MNILQNEITGTQTSLSTNFGVKLSFILSFLFPELLHHCYIYIFTAPTCTTTIITFKPCALNAEIQHFILRFNKISVFGRYHWKRGIGGWKRGWRQGDFRGDMWYFVVVSWLFVWSKVSCYLCHSLAWQNSFVKLGDCHLLQAPQYIKLSTITYYAYW
jgi:hypothetical protein